MPVHSVFARLIGNRIVAVTANTGGRREIIGPGIGPSEAWAGKTIPRIVFSSGLPFRTGFLRSLKARGLGDVRLVISNAHTGSGLPLPGSSRRRGKAAASTGSGTHWRMSRDSTAPGFIRPTRASARTRRSSTVPMSSAFWHFSTLIGEDALILSLNYTNQFIKQGGMGMAHAEGTKAVPEGK